MQNETEKLTINLGVVELAQIDVLVEQGIYSNRSDFIRTAVRKNIEKHKEKIELSLTPIVKKEDLTKTIGIMKITKKSLEALLKDNKKLNLSIIGMLIFDTNISPKLFESTVDSVIIRGKLVSSKEIKKIIDEMN